MDQYLRKPDIGPFFNKTVNIMNIALVAHDGRKKELMEWVRYNWETLSKHNLYATGTTGKLVIRELTKAHLDMIGLGNYPDEYPGRLNALYTSKVTCLNSGPLGGDQQIGAMIAEGKIDVLVFFCDNLIIQGHQNDVSALVRLASLYNIAFATNRTTADMILTSPLFDNPEYKRILPAAIENYKNRQV